MKDVLWRKNKMGWNNKGKNWNSTYEIFFYILSVYKNKGELLVHVVYERSIVSSFFENLWRNRIIIITEETKCWLSF